MASQVIATVTYTFAILTAHEDGLARTETDELLDRYVMLDQVELEFMPGRLLRKDYQILSDTPIILKIDADLD